MSATLTAFFPRIAFSLLVACATSTGSDQGSKLASGAPTIGSHGNSFSVLTPSGVVAISLGVDATVETNAEPVDIRVLDKAADRVILVDTYLSRSGGMSYCQAGEEQFLRVISVGVWGAIESARVKLTSCIQGIELQEPGLQLEADRSTLYIKWLKTSDASPAELVLHFDGT